MEPPHTLENQETETEPEIIWRFARAREGSNAMMTHTRSCQELWSNGLLCHPIVVQVLLPAHAKRCPRFPSRHLTPLERRSGASSISEGAITNTTRLARGQHVIRRRGCRRGAQATRAGERALHETPSPRLCESFTLEELHGHTLPPSIPESPVFPRARWIVQGIHSIPLGERNRTARRATTLVFMLAGVTGYSAGARQSRRPTTSHTNILILQRVLTFSL
jgi:hypothetical protein